MGEARLKSANLQDALGQATVLVSEALALLDDANAPADIGAHLDLALHRMKRDMTKSLVS